MTSMRNRCCICGEGTPAESYKQVRGHSLVRCGGCGLVYLQDIVSDDKDFIEKAEKDLSGSQDREKVEFWSFPELYDKHRPIFEKFFQERLDYISSFKSGLKSTFDIGCGYGFWLKFCQDRGIAVDGLDNSAAVVEWIRGHYDFPVHARSFQDHEFTAAYDFMTMCDVLEHVADPNLTLRKVRAGLLDGGLLFVQVPNLLGFKLPPGHGYGLPFHLWQFSSRTIKRLLEKNGFRMLGYRTGIMGVIGVYENGGPTLLDRLHWFGARNLKLGNRLMVVAQKEGASLERMASPDTA